MTYAFVVGHTLFTLSCSFVSICMLMSYIYNFSLFSHFYLEKIYITIICYLSFLPNNEK